MLLKTAVHAKCLLLIEEKITMLSNVLQSLAESAADETKSSAGDKHETAKSMVHLEQEKVDRQLNEIQLQKAALLKIDTTQSASKIIKGSLVQTNNGLFYISVALGKMEFSNQFVWCISPESPLGKALMGLSKNEVCIFNGTNYTIENVY